MKSRRGFTLMEMIAVVAIIVFLAGFSMAGISNYAQRARDLSANIDAHSAALDAQEDIIRGYLMTTRGTLPRPTTDTQMHPGNPTDAPEPDPDPTEAPPPDPTPTETETEATEPPTEATTTTTQAPTETATPPSGGKGNPKGKNNAPGAKVEVTNSWSGGAQIQWTTDGSQANYFIFYAPGTTNFNSWTGNADIKIDGDYVYMTLTNGATSNGAGGQFDGVSKPGKIKLVYYEMK